MNDRYLYRAKRTDNGEVRMCRYTDGYYRGCERRWSE